MNKLLVISALAILATACGGSDNKPAGDPSSTNTTSDPKAADPKATTPASSGTPASTGTPTTDTKK